MPSSPKQGARIALYLALIYVVKIVFVGLLSMHWQPVAAAAPAGNTITVNSTSDAANDDGLCTLREAITAANSNTASGATAGECIAGSSSEPDTINLTGVTGTITLGSALPDITSDMSLNGPGASQLTISGNNSFRVFKVSIWGPALINFSGLTIANGRIQDVGGGIYNERSADVNVTGTVLTNNFAVLGGGIANSSTGTFTITSSTLNNNQAHTGAACSNGLGILTIINSTLFSNVAGAQGGLGGGGAIVTGSNALNIINSTLHNNTGLGQGGGILNLGIGSNINITNSTITQNFSLSGGGGGINNQAGGIIKVLNTIIADNNTNPLQAGPDLVGAFVSLGHNLLTNNADNTGFTNGVNGDLVGSSSARIIPRLGLLQNNGGPTMTRALLPGSPAIDAGDNCVVLASGSGGCLATPLTTDQRGVTRQVNGTVDMGAYESRGFTLSATSGTPQSAPVFTFFAPLVVTVGSVGGDPVAGGVVQFVSPASGPSTIFTNNSNTVLETINANGTANPAPLANLIAGGPYTVTATISGVPGSAAFSLTNTQAATTTVVTSSSNPSDVTQSVTFTATVTSTGPLTGTVQFKIDNVNVGGPVTLNAGVATFTTSALTIGTHSVTADYSGDANFLPSSGALAGGQIVRPPPSVSIFDITITEGNSGTKQIFFSVGVSPTSNLPVSVDFATADNTATSPSDYLPTSGTLTFDPGIAFKQIFVTINGDTTLELDETFRMNISNPVNATIARAQGTATIQNDEAPVLLTEPNTNHVIALDSVTLTRDPFRLTNLFNFSGDNRRRISLFVWRLGLFPGDTLANVSVQADDSIGRIYILTVESVTPVTGLDDVNQIIVRLPDEVLGAPRNLGVTVRVRNPPSNRAFITIQGP